MSDDFESELARDAAAMRQNPTEDQLQRVRNMGLQLNDITLEIAVAEERLKNLKSQRFEIAHRQLPDLMMESGLDIIGIPAAGVDIELKPFYKASIPEENREPAAAYLRKEGHGDLMRTTLSVEFGAGEDEHAVACAELVKGYFRGRNDIQREVSLASLVHWKTLTAFVKEQIEAGATLPLDLLGAIVGKVASVSRKKKVR